MKKLLHIILGAFLFSISLFAFAQGIPDASPIESLLALVRDFKSMSPLALGMGFVVILVQVLKAEFFGAIFSKFKYKRFAIVILGQAYAVMFLIAQGSSLLDAFTVGLISSGGAVAIYEAFKGLKKK